jgi:hypothetical protein
MSPKALLTESQDDVEFVKDSFGDAVRCGSTEVGVTSSGRERGTDVWDASIFRDEIMKITIQV